MGEHRTSRIERIVHRIEEHVEDWRRQEAARYAEVEANREHLWAEAAERERLLVEAMGEEEAHRDSIEEIAKEQRVVFVMHSEEVARALEDFAGEGDCLVKVVPRRGGNYTAAPGIKGSWLVFETSE
jgi:hypothetical protein